jgi:predicted DNA repair protein MutK
VTVGVYGLVGIIVKLDDMGYWLVKKSSALARWVGNGLLAVAPRLMKLLSIVGTLAMFLVGGGIIVHGIAPLHHAVEHWVNSPLIASLLPTGVNLVLGFIVGAVVLAA